MRMPTGHNQGQHRKIQLLIPLLTLLQQHGVDVTFEMINGDERLVEGEGQGLGVANSDE